MKKRTRWIGGLMFLCFFMAFTFPFSINESDDIVAVDLCQIDNSTFKEGEKLTYKVYYHLGFMWIPAGEVVFLVAEKDNEYHLSCTGNTYSSYEWFYKVRDRYDCYIDKETLLPRESIRDIKEGSYRLYDHISYDQGAQKTVSLRGRSKEKLRERNFDVNGCMHDILSILYYIRNLNFNQYEEGSLLPIKVFFDKEVLDLKVKYWGKDGQKKIKGHGKLNTIQFSPELLKGDFFKEGSKMKVWVSDDENKIPLLVESPLSVGAVKVVLKEYKGLKYELGM